MSYIVYKHTTPNGKVYIGITNRTPEVRWGKNGCGYKRNTHFYSAIKKYGWDAIKHEILYSELSKENACQLEKDLIKKFNSTDRTKGYNISIGGESGSLGVKPSKETRKKLSESHKGKTLSYEHKKHLSESHKGSGHGGFAKGRIVTDEIRKKIGTKHSIPIMCVQTGQIFKSSVEASNIMKLNKSAICMTLKGLRTHTRGFSFVYTEEAQ